MTYKAGGTSLNNSLFTVQQQAGYFFIYEGCLQIPSALLKLIASLARPFTVFRASEVHF